MDFDGRLTIVPTIPRPLDWAFDGRRPILHLPGTGLMYADNGVQPAIGARSELQPRSRGFSQFRLSAVAPRGSSRTARRPVNGPQQAIALPRNPPSTAGLNRFAESPVNGTEQAQRHNPEIDLQFHRIANAFHQPSPALCRAETANHPSLSHRFDRPQDRLRVDLSKSKSNPSRKRKRRFTLVVGPAMPIAPSDVRLMPKRSASKR